MTAATNPTHPLRDLIGRYGAVFQAAWQHRRELAGPQRHADEAAFLPAALSLQEAPVHPAPRRFALAICALFVHGSGLRMQTRALRWLFSPWLLWPLTGLLAAAFWRQAAG